MKKLLSMAVALCLCLSIGVTAFAKAPAKPITIGPWTEKNEATLDFFYADTDGYYTTSSGSSAKYVLAPDQEIRALLTLDATDDSDATFADAKLVLKVSDGKEMISDYGIVKTGGEYYAYITFKDTYSTSLTELDFECYLTKKSSSTKLEIASVSGDFLSNLDADSEVMSVTFPTTAAAGTSGSDKGVYFGNKAIYCDDDDAELDASVTDETPVINFKEEVKSITLEGDNYSFSTTAAKQGKLYVKATGEVTTITKAIATANDNADITIVDFLGRPDFDFTGDLSLFPSSYDEDTTYYCYSVGTDGKLTQVGTWDKDDECFKVRARTLGTYLIADTKLSYTPVSSSEDSTSSSTSSTDSTTTSGTSDATADEDKDNPSMGTNDMVGVAVALAVVSVAAAGAVALKR